jgi:hypothetical protein
MQLELRVGQDVTLGIGRVENDRAAVDDDLQSL